MAKKRSTAVPAGTPAASTGAATVDDEVAAEIAAIAASVTEAVGAGQRDAALAHLAEERATARRMITMAQQIEAGLAALEDEVRRSSVCWPLVDLRYGGELRPAGQELHVEPELLARLLADGVVSDTAPSAS